PIFPAGLGGGGGGAGDCAFDPNNTDPSSGTGSVAGDGWAIVTFIADASTDAKPVTVAPTKLNGHGQHLVEKDRGTVRIDGQFLMPKGLQLDQQLDQATFALTHLVSEVSGVGELSRQSNHARHLPITLKAQPTRKPSDAVYKTAPGVTPQVSVEITRRLKNGL